MGDVCTLQDCTMAATQSDLRFWAAVATDPVQAQATPSPNKYPFSAKLKQYDSACQISTHSLKRTKLVSQIQPRTGARTQARSLAFGLCGRHTLAHSVSSYRRLANATCQPQRTCRCRFVWWRWCWPLGVPGGRSCVLVTVVRRASQHAEH